MCTCGEDHDQILAGRRIYAGGDDRSVSRRNLLRGGAALVAGGAAGLFAQVPAGAQAPAAAQPPAAPGLATANGGVIFWGANPGTVDPKAFLAERQEKSMVGQVFGVDTMREAVQVAADRSTITSVIRFS